MTALYVKRANAVDDLASRFQAMTLDEHDAQMNMDPGNDMLSSQQLRAQGGPGIDEELLDTLGPRLIHRNAITCFNHNFESVIRRWFTLLSETTPPTDTLSTDSRFISAFRALDGAITAVESDTKLLSRLAYVQLVRVIGILESRVALDRQAGRLHRRNGYRNASIALDIYLSAQDKLSPSSSRRALINRKRLAKRWSALAGPWPLFLLVYSEEAEGIVFDTVNFQLLVLSADVMTSQCYGRLDNATLRQLAARILRESPTQLQEVCEQTARVIEAAVTEKQPVNNRIVRRLVEKCQIGLRGCGPSSV